MTPEFILFVILLLQVKHFFADYALQTVWMIRNKGNYGHPGGLAHAGLHGVFTFVVLIVTGFDPVLSALVSVGEIVIHYHIDYAKDRITRMRKPDPNRREYWVFHGLDQFCHQATLVGVVAVLLWFG
ncbi:MAG: DUF3307 domain-containing protein [Maritimibacter harenae]|jgi:hypothetical protein